MNDIIIKINKLDRTVLPEKTIIGNDGENLQCKLVFEFEDNFVDGIGRVEYSAGEDKNYIWISKEDNKYYLPIKDVVTKEGNINFQLVITEEQTTDGIPLFKSNVFTLYCKESINAVEEAPEGYELWIDQANQKIMEMDNLNIEVNKIDDVCYITLTDKDGNTKVVTVNDGNGIVSIEKTGTSGLVDTYTIIFTDGTTTTFQVTNGADGEVTMEQFEQAMMVYNALPKVTGSGTSVTLNDTAECPLKIDLKGNTYQFTTSGKNLFNKNVTMTSSGASKSTLPTGIRITQTTSGTFKNVYFLFGQSELLGKTITLHSTITNSASNNGGALLWFGNSGNPFVSRIGQLTASGSTTINIPSSFASNTDRIIMNFYSNRDGTGNVNDYVDYTDLQIELGSAYTGYEDYTGGIASPNPDYPQEVKIVSGNNTITISNEDNSQSQTYPINLGNVELCKFGEYQDYIYKSNNKWYVHKENGKIILNGNENISGYEFGNYYRYSVSTSTLNITPKSNTSMLSNYFYHDSQTLDIGACQVGMFFYASNYSNIYFISNENNAANFKTWLGTHNTKIYYILANATDTEITDSTLINQLNDLAFAYSYDTQTNIIQSNNDLPFIITATGIRTLENIFNGGL